MIKILFISTVLATSFNAFATSSLSCVMVGSPDIKFYLDVGMTDGLGSPILNAEGEISVKPTDGAPKKSSYTFSKQSIPQYWNSNYKLNFVLYAERNGDKNSIDSVKITIETDYGAGTNDYRGKALIQYDWKDGDSPKNWSAPDVSVVCSYEG